MFKIPEHVLPGDEIQFVKDNFDDIPTVVLISHSCQRFSIKFPFKTNKVPLYLDWLVCKGRVLITHHHPSQNIWELCNFEYETGEYKLMGLTKDLLLEEWKVVRSLNNYYKDPSDFKK